MTYISRLVTVFFVIGITTDLSAQSAAGGQQSPLPGVGASVPRGQAPAMPPRDTAPQPRTGRGRISGRVVASPSGTPLRRARVTLQTPESMQLTRVVVTDAQGRYEFAELASGRYSISAAKPGYLGLQFGQRRPFESGTPVVLNDSQRLDAVDFALPRGSAITGRITDEFGEPLAQAQVQALRFQYMPDGQRRLSAAQSAATDDRGEFRLYGLMPGEYVVQASFRNGGDVYMPPGSVEPGDTYPPTFYPGTTNVAAARMVTVTLAEEQAVEFSLIAGRLALVRGIAVDSEGRPAFPAEVLLMSRGGELFSSPLQFRQTASDGSFAIPGVAPGEYTVEVRRQTDVNGPVAAESASTSISVLGDDISGLRIATSKGIAVSGRVIFEGASVRPTTSGERLTVGALPAELGGSRWFSSDDSGDGVVQGDGSFRLGGVSGRVFLSVSTNPRWSVKSITLDGQDISEALLDVSGHASVDGVIITMTDRLTSVSGIVTDGRGSPARDYVAVVLRADERESPSGIRFVRTARPDTNGQFEVRALRPGRYVAAAVEWLEQGRQFSPEFQRQLRRGAREFTLGEGEALKIELTTISGQ